MNETEAAASGFGNLTPTMKWLLVWGVLLGSGAVGLSYLAFIVYWTWQSEGWVKEIVQQHFAATVGLPLASVGAFLLVQVLQISAGRIEFEALGIRVKGASGPVILWSLCFLSIAAAIRLLW